MSPVADAATRTYTVKVSIPARDDVRLGMTAVVQLAHAGTGTAIHVPLSALVIRSFNRGFIDWWHTVTSERALASFKVPVAVVRVESLPRTALGKVQKHLLPNP